MRGQPHFEGSDVVDSTADYVYPIIDYILEVKQRLDRGEALSLDQVQATLGRLLARKPTTEQAASGTDLAASSELAKKLPYVMVCLIDEFFIAYTSWSERWNERKLESKNFNTNDRAWEIWRGANLAPAAVDVELVEVYLVCVMLGFRGQLADDPHALEDWVGKALRLIEARGARLCS